jgi:hypothetical protein
MNPPLPPAPARAARLARYIVGFGVSFIIGLAPYLGRVRVPGFTPLLSLIPNSIQDVAIPISAAVMGVVAVVVQWWGYNQPTRAWRVAWFKRTVFLFVMGAVVLTTVRIFVVVRVPFRGGKDSETFIVGFVRPVKPPCTEEISDAECIKYLTFDQSRIASFWGDRQVRLAELSLILTYVALTSSFGFLVGLFILKDR